MLRGYGLSLLMNGWVASGFPLKRSNYIFLAEMGIRRFFSTGGETTACFSSLILIYIYIASQAQE